MTITEKRLDCPKCGRILSALRTFEVGNNWRFHCYGTNAFNSFFACKWYSGIIGGENNPKNAIKANLDGSVEFRKTDTKVE